MKDQETREKTRPPSEGQGDKKQGPQRQKRKEEAKKRERGRQR